MSDISQERIERAARAVCLAMGDDWKREGPRGLLKAYGHLARATLEADAPEIEAAEARGRIAGLREASEAATKRSEHYAQAAIRHHGEILGDVYTEKCGVSASIASAIDARISALANTPDARESDRTDQPGLETEK